MASYNTWRYCLINLVLLTSSVNATEYWKATTTHSVSELNAKGQKTNYETQQPINDVVKKAKLTYTDSVKDKLGITAKDRLFNNINNGGQYSSLAAAQIRSFFEAKTFIVDQQSKSIYSVDEGGSIGCKNFGYKWQHSAQEYNCPIDAAESGKNTQCVGNITNCQLVNLYADQYYTVLVSSLPNTKDKAPAKIYAKYEYTYKPNGAKDFFYIIVNKGSETEISESQRKTLTNKEIATYLISSSQSISDLYKPDNVFEITNNKAYLDLAFALNSSTNEVSPDTGIKPDLDPTTGQPTGGFNLPEACDWLKPLCDFFAWMKEEVSEPSDTKVDIQQHDFDDQGSPELQDYLDYQKQCPAPIVKQLKIFNYDWAFTFEYDFLCLYFNKLSSFLIAFAYCMGAYIIAGVRNA